MFYRVPIAIAAIAWPTFTLAVDKAQCFNPDGSKADADIPCFGSDSLSRVCCSPNQVCSTNKLCVSKESSSPPQIFRGSCLDPSFGPSCPTFCTGLNKNQQSAVVSCGDPKEGTFCCDEGKQAECCASPSKILTLGVGNTFPEGLATSSVLSMGSMMNAPAAKSPQPLISVQTNTIISFLTPTSPQAQMSRVSQSSTASISSTTSPSGSSAQPAVTPPNPSSPGLPTISFAEVEVLRPTSQATPSSDAKTSIEAAIIAGAQTNQPALSSSPPLSAITIASAAIGGVLLVTLIIVVSVIILRWRAARLDEERRIQEDSVGSDYKGEIRRSTTEKEPGGESSFSSAGRPRDEERGMQMSGGAGSLQVGRGMAEIGSPNGFVVTDRSNQYPRIARPNIIQASEDLFGSELSSAQWPNEERDLDRSAGLSTTEYYRTSEPFSRRISLQPYDRALSDERRASQASGLPTKGYERGSEWSVATLMTERQNNLSRFGQGRRVSTLEGEANLIRSRFQESDRDREQTPLGKSNLRAPPMVETTNGMRVPAAALERRVSKGSLDTTDSETFQKLLFDVQSGPF
ncbi:hypothetical protein BKA65DRAFT_130225 [Rhexocercosporidium sp. MPI-PUGE-AT-0058]|nr:hypothetical protein BKA65DRAFT_130225 [Rhexocercosporidium sp. MPI-PUGE-AT-0058]